MMLIHPASKLHEQWIEYFINHLDFYFVRLNYFGIYLKMAMTNKLLINWILAWLWGLLSNDFLIVQIGMIFSLLQEAFLGQVTQSHSQYHRQLRLVWVFFRKMMYRKILEMIFSSFVLWLWDLDQMRQWSKLVLRNNYFSSLHIRNVRKSMKIFDLFFSWFSKK